MKNSHWKQLLDAPWQVIRLLVSMIWQLISVPFKAVGRLLSSRSANMESGDYGYRPKSGGSVSQSVVGPLADACRLIWQGLQYLLVFPFRLAAYLFSNAKGELIWCVPALLAAALLTFVAYRVAFDQDSMRRQYRLGANQAMQDGAFELASTYGQKLASWPGESQDADRLNWARCLFETGQTRLGAQIINDLAPDKATGYPPAHRYKALSISQRLRQTHEPGLREPLRWHLKNSSNQDVEDIQFSYALYYMETGQLNLAVPYLEIAAARNPAHYITLAGIYLSRNDEPSSRDALRLAEKGFRKLLTKDSLNHPARILLAKTVSKLDRNAEAEKLLRDGLSLKDGPRIRRALADFYLMSHDQSNDFEQQLAFIQQSLEHDINYQATYQRILAHLESKLESDPEKARELEALLTENVNSHKPTAINHFALSNLCSFKGDIEQAKWHMEKAYELEPRFGVIANNLAWMLAHEDNPDLDRAYELATDVVKHHPKEPRMRDTLATVLMKQEKWEEALTQFELVLGQTENTKSKQAVHANLAVVYEKLGKPKMAELHRKMAEDLSKHLSR